MREIIHLLQKPSRYLGTEINSIHKDPSRIGVRVALAFPDIYEVGMSYIGQRILYHQVNKHENYWAERVFAPGLDAASVLREKGCPLATLESDTPLVDMDVLAFSLTHELCYTTILYMLDLARIPLRSEQRKDAHPLVIAGGGSVFNAEPVAPFFDCMVLGDGEEVLPELLQVVDRCKRAGMDRETLLEKLGELQGVYVPSCWIDPTKKTDDDGIPAIERRILPSLNNVDFPTNQIVPFGKPVHDRFSLEIARGCTRGCRFCQAGMIYRPVRERSLPVLDGILRKGLSETGYEELSFLSLSSGDFSTLTGLFEQSIARCAAEKVSISLPSLRVGSVNPRLLSMIASIRRTGVTLAPEAGSQRLRDVINKGIREEDLLEHVSSLFDLGWNAVKLYFMIGLPTETRADLEAIRDLALKVLQCAGPKRKRLQVTVSISPFVPKPHTPFQWERQLSRDECRERIDFLKEILRPYRKIKLRWHEPNMSFLEGVFSRGDRSLAELVEKAYQRGALFSSWIEHLDIRVWEELMEELSIDPGAYLRERAEQEPLPWDHLRSGVNKSFLLRERRNAFQGEMTSDCRYGACHNCGVCTGMDAPGHSGSKNEPIRPIVNSSMRDQKAGAELVSADRMGSGNKEMLLRIWHEKTGFAKFLSQLELQTILERSLRRAEIPMAFSEGFHPSPILSFGRALPVGVASREEWFCVWLQKLIDPSSVMQSLAETMPMGLNLVRVERMEGKKRHPQADFEDFFLSYKLPADQVPPHLRKWDRLMERSEHLWRHETKRGVRTVDIRPFLSEVKANSSTMVLRFCWREGYLSPMKLIHAVDPDLQPGQFELTKFRQWMPQSAMIPDLQ